MKILSHTLQNKNSFHRALASSTYYTMTPSIIATCKQTRFHLLHDQPAQEVHIHIPIPISTTDHTLIQPQIDVEGLTIAVTSSPAESADDADPPNPKATGKSKSKSKAEARELIVDAHLRLKAGVHYGLIGRNGTGKSSMFIARLAYEEPC